MRFSKFFLLTASVVLALVLSTSLSVAGRQNGNGFLLMAMDAGTGMDTVYCGFGHPTSTTTYGVDADTFDMPQYGVSVLETALPPIPPSGVFDLRFIDSRTGAGISLDQGIANNFHQGYFTPIVDTFKVSIRSSVSVDDSHPFVISWVLPTHATITSCKIKYVDPDDGPIFVDMVANSTLSLTKSGIENFNIIWNGIPLGVREISNVVPETFALNQNYPNPFNPTTTFSFAIKQASDVTIAVYDILGKQIATITQAQYSPGSFNATWNGTNDNGVAVASGTYYIRMNARYQQADGASDEFVSVQKVMLMK